MKPILYMNESQLFCMIEILAVFDRQLLFLSTDVDNFFFACYYPLTVSHSHQISALYIILPLSYKEHITKKNHFFMRYTRKIKFLDYNKIREKGCE